MIYYKNIEKRGQKYDDKHKDLANHSRKNEK